MISAEVEVAASKPYQGKSKASAGLGLLLASLLCTCSSVKEPLPPGFQSLKIQMSLSELRQQRPNVTPDGPSRYYDPSGPVAFRIEKERVVGIRILIHVPADQAAVAYYARNFKRQKTENYSYTINERPLKLYASDKGVEIIYGLDPGSALQSMAGPEETAKDKPPPPFPPLSVKRLPALGRAQSYPVGRIVNGVELWLHPLALNSNASQTDGSAPDAFIRNKACKLFLILGSGSVDEAPNARGSTAMVGALAQEGIFKSAREHQVRVEQISLRTSLLFSLTGAAEDVSAIAIALAKKLSALGKKEEPEQALRNAYATTLRLTVRTRFSRRLLEDEGFAAIFGGDAYRASPVQRNQNTLSAKIIQNRASEVALAAASVIVSGAIDLDYADAIAAALGARKTDSRKAAPKPRLPQRESKKVSSPALSIDGLWVDTSTVSPIAKLLLARALLEQEATRDLRFKRELSTRPMAVIAGGQVFASYLMMINVVRSQDAQAMGLAARSLLSQLGHGISSGQAFNDLRSGAIAKLALQLASPETAAELMVDFKLMGAKFDWIEKVIARMHSIDAEALKAFLSAHNSAEHTFSVRWGPSQ